MIPPDWGVAATAGQRTRHCSGVCTVHGLLRQKARIALRSNERGSESFSAYSAYSRLTAERRAARGAFYSTISLPVLVYQNRGGKRGYECRPSPRSRIRALRTQPPVSLTPTMRERRNTMCHARIPRARARFSHRSGRRLHPASLGLGPSQLAAQGGLQLERLCNEGIDPLRHLGGRRDVGVESHAEVGLADVTAPDQLVCARRTCRSRLQHAR